MVLFRIKLKHHLLKDVLQKLQKAKQICNKKVKRNQEIRRENKKRIINQV